MACIVGDIEEWSSEEEAESPEGDIEWVDEGGGEGELTVTVPAIPEQGVPETKLVARGSRKSASAKVASAAGRILSSSKVQAILPPQAKLALSAARGLSRLVPQQWKKAGVKLASKAAGAAVRKLKFW